MRKANFIGGSYALRMRRVQTRFIPIPQRVHEARMTKLVTHGFGLRHSCFIIFVRPAARRQHTQPAEPTAPEWRLRPNPSRRSAESRSSRAFPICNPEPAIFAALLPR